MPDASVQPGDVSAAHVADASGEIDGHLPEVAVSSAHLRDLAALLALPRMWRERDASFIAGSLIDVIVSLVRSDIAFVRLECGPDEVTFEQARPMEAFADGALLRRLESEPAAVQLDVAEIRGVAASGSLRLFRVPSQLGDQRALAVIGSRRPDFPTEVETFLCRVAVEQGMIALHSSRLVTSLTAANAAKATFLATMSHELRTPLNAIVGYSELLQAEISGMLNSQQKEYVRRVDGAARHLMGLIEGILNFARIEAGKERVQLGDVDAAQVAEGVLAFLEPLARAKGLSIRTTVERPATPLCTDSAKVRQILLNLLSNAVKFTNRGEIALDVRPDGADMLWIVTDDGIGIAPEDLDRIFEPFQQVGDQHSARAPGTGLGLSVSRQLARLLGGDVTAESTLGSGSTFTLRLPLDPPVDTMPDVHAAMPGA